MRKKRKKTREQRDWRSKLSRTNEAAAASVRRRAAFGLVLPWGTSERMDRSNSKSLFSLFHKVEDVWVVQSNPKANFAQDRFCVAILRPVSRS